MWVFLCFYADNRLESDSYVGKYIAWRIDEIQRTVGSDHTIGVALAVENVVKVNAGSNIAIGVAKRYIKS